MVVREFVVAVAVAVAVGVVFVQLQLFHVRMLGELVLLPHVLWFQFARWFDSFQRHVLLQLCASFRRRFVLSFQLAVQLHWLGAFYHRLVALPHLLDVFLLQFLIC